MYNVMFMLLMPSAQAPAAPPRERARVQRVEVSLEQLKKQQQTAARARPTSDSGVMTSQQRNNNNTAANDAMRPADSESGGGASQARDGDVSAAREREARQKQLEETKCV